MGPVFDRHMFDIAEKAKQDFIGEPVKTDFVSAVHDAMAESMLTLILGMVGAIIIPL